MFDNDNTQMSAQQILEIPADTVEQPEVVESHQENSVESEAPSETPQAKNFRQLRESKERAERERDEALKLLHEMSAKAQAQSAPEEEIDLSLSPDEFVDGRHLSKVDKKIKNLEQQLKNYQKQSYESMTEARIKAEYPDFDLVVNHESVSELRRSEPILAETIHSTSDLYAKAVAAYKMIKQMGIKSPSSYEQDKQAIARNVAKPRPTASITPQQGEGALSKANAFANGLTPALKDQLLKEMQSVRKAS